jgi:hypothetical protein
MKMREKVSSKRTAAFAFGLAISVFNSNSLRAQSYDQGPIFSVIEENDLVVKTDRHYTQGIKLSYLHADGFLPGWSTNFYEDLPEFGFEKAVGKFGYEIGQNIYTPADLQSSQLLRNDRPYGGYLYIGAILQRRGSNWLQRPFLESFQLDIGVIGPWALGKEAQTWVHELRDFDLPQGWRNQIKNEPAIELKYLRSARFSFLKFDPIEFDFIPHSGFSLGNVEATARLGGQIRIGLNLPDDFGIQTIDSLATSSGGFSKSQTDSHWGAYVFAGSEGKAVLHNAFLDGNLFRSSHSVEKEYLVGDFKAGFALVLAHIELGYTFTFRTPEFHGQTESDSFGSFFLKAKF